MLEANRITNTSAHRTYARIAYAFALLIALTAIAACGGGSSDSADENAASDQKSADQWLDEMMLTMGTVDSMRFEVSEVSGIGSQQNTTGIYSAIWARPGQTHYYIYDGASNTVLAESFNVGSTAFTRMGDGAWSEFPFEASTSGLSPEGNIAESDDFVLTGLSHFDCPVQYSGSVCIQGLVGLQEGSDATWSDDLGNGILVSMFIDSNTSFLSGLETLKVDLVAFDKGILSVPTAIVESAEVSQQLVGGRRFTYTEHNFDVPADTFSILD